MVSNSIENAQKKVEGNNFDMRKSLLDYDNVVNEQRTIIYERRNEILDNENIHDSVIEIFKNTIANLVDNHIEPEGYITEDDKSEIVEFVNTNYFDEIEYLRKTNNAAVKKTLTIPEWLNTMAINANINFSQTLQEALKAKLNI